MKEAMPDARWARLGIASATGSLVALAAQGLLALVLLRSFDARTAGLFSVLAQLAFFWATLALAQSPVSLLAERQQPAVTAAHVAWRQSLQRWLWLLPLVLAGLWWSMPPEKPSMGLWSGLFWLVPLSLTQLAWYLAQSLVLRTRGPIAVAAVRLLPAVLALGVVALALAWPEPWQQLEVLLLATVLGFAGGALWLGPAWRPPGPVAATQAAIPTAVEMRGDDRPLALRTLHTLSDVGALTLLALHWQALHGSAAAGYLLILLRLAGFVPALVHAAWSQVALAHAAHAPARALRAALAGWSLLAMLGLVLQQADAHQWLGPGWQGLSAWAAPVLVWQAGATALACLAHRPLQTGHARAWSWANIGLNLWLVTLVLLPDLPAGQHLQWLGYGAASAHAVLALWLWQLRSSR
jgi:hypothetical protein